jgi:hypothetical protein
MIVYTNKKTGVTYPERGGNFTYWSDYNAKPNKFHCFIRGIGWKYYPAKDWESKEIPDLPDKDFKKNPIIFREYAERYGIDVAAAQLPCADVCKYSWASLFLDPNYPSDETQKWFYETFNKHGNPNEYPDFMKKSMWDFMESSIGMVCGKFMFDLLKFEDYLVREFDYDKNSKQSMSQFIVKEFGQTNHDKFEKEMFKMYLTSQKKKSKVAV